MNLAVDSSEVGPYYNTMIEVFMHPGQKKAAVLRLGRRIRAYMQAHYAGGRGFIADTIWIHASGEDPTLDAWVKMNATAPPIKPGVNRVILIPGGWQLINNHRMLP